MGLENFMTMNWPLLLLIVFSTTNALADQPQKTEQIEQAKEYSQDSGYAVAHSYGGSNDEIQTAAQYQQGAYAANNQYQQPQSPVYSYNQQAQGSPIQPANFQPIIGYGQSALSSAQQSNGYEQLPKVDDYKQQSVQSQNGYSGDYSNVKAGIPPKKTVILAIPVKLALQLPENKQSYNNAAHDAEKPQQNTYSPSTNYASNNYANGRNQEQGQTGYPSSKSHDEAPKNDYRSQQGPSYDGRQSYVATNYEQNSYEQQQAPQQSYDQPKEEYKSNYGGNSQYYGSNKENSYSKSSPSKQSNYEPVNYVDNKASDNYNGGYENEQSNEDGKGTDSYKSHQPQKEEISSYGGSEDAGEYSPKGKRYSAKHYVESEGEYGSGKNKYKFGKGEAYPTLSGSYDGDQDDWQSGAYMSSLNSGKGSKYEVDEGPSFSADDSDDTDSYKSDTDSVKSALGNYGSLKDYEIKDYSAMFGGKGDLKDYASMKDYSSSMKELSALKDFVSLKDKPRKLHLPSNDADSIEEDYDSSSPSLTSYSTGDSSSLSGLSSYESQLSDLSGLSNAYSKGFSIKAGKPSISYGSSSGLSLGESAYESMNMGSVGSVHSGNPLLSSFTDSSYEGSSLSSPFITSSGFNYGSASSSLGGNTGVSFKNPPMTPSFTISEGVIGDSIPSISYGSNIHLQGSSSPSNGVPSYNNNGALQLSGNPSESYGSSPQLDFSSLYGSVMRPSYGPMIPMGPASYGPGPQHPPGPGYSPSGSSYPTNGLYGKPNGQQKQPKYTLRFPRYRPSALSLYKGSSVSAPNKIRSSLLGSLYSSGSSPAKFYLKGPSGKGSSIFGSGLRLSPSSSSKKPSSSFTSPFRYSSALDSLFGQIYKLL